MLLGVYNGQTVYDLIQKVSAPLEDSIAIGFANGLTFDSSNTPLGGTQFFVDNEFINTQPLNIVYSATTAASTISNLQAINSQSIYDVCLMTYGNLESITLLKKENLDVAPVSGEIFSFDTTKISNFQFYYNVKNKFGYLCSTEDFTAPPSSGYLLTESSNYLITENSMYILV